MAHPETLFRHISVKSSDIGIRKIGTRDLWTSLKEGYEDFNAKPSFGIFLIVIYPLFALLLTLIAVGEKPLQLAFPILAGLTLLGPVVSVGPFRDESASRARTRSQLAFSIRLHPHVFIRPDCGIDCHDDTALCRLAVHGAIYLCWIVR